MAEAAANLEWAKLQAATSLDLRKDIGSIERFSGDVGELNHFLRSGDGVSQRIAERQRTGRLDALDAESLRSALVRRVQRSILNLLQADESTTWAELKQRLQKEYGGGRWTPEEDALRMLRLTRGPRQTKGEFAAVILRHFSSVVDKYRETLPGPDANAKIGLVESLVRVQLQEATDAPVTGSVVEEANRLIDAAGREEEREPRYVRISEWRGRGRQDEGRRPAERRPPTHEGRRGSEVSGGRRGPSRRQGGQQRREEPRCYSCGKKGHVQAKCARVKCFECGTPGHLARECPYMRPQRRPRDEPMEVNFHSRERTAQRRSTSRSDGQGSGEDRDAGGETSDSGESASTYATVVKEGQPRRTQAGQRGTTGR